MPKVWTREAELLVEEVLDRQAAEVDRTGTIPPEHFDELGRRGFYGFLLSEGMTPDILIDTVSTVLSGCLATGFVWAQHLGAVRAVAFTDNAALRDRYLPAMTSGAYRCGVSYAGARTTPTLFAERTDKGFVLDGTAPFVTGWGHISGLATSVRVREAAGESVVTLLIPLDEVDGLTPTPIPLIAANASATVRLAFEQTVVDDSRVIATTPVGEFRSSREGVADWINGALPLGVLAGCIRELKEHGVDVTAYEAQYASLRARFAPALGNADATYTLRADIAHAAVAAAAAAVVAAGSRAVVIQATPERLMRQATFALVCTTRDPIKTALLSRLTPDAG
ncbi:acyl-CoA dehydrogenase family protein [Nocardia sp. CA-128927]|uniref:acyl-CoA dehydrogenase family protein n=1 Tax=Nocardia sp. CA-128927 TaxID=3239975 RepID=UPI003D976529